MEEQTKRCKDSEETVSSLRALEPLVKQLQFRTNLWNWFNAYQDRIEQIKTLETTSNRLQLLKEEYGAILEVVVEATPQQLQEQMRQMHQQRSSLQRRLDDLDAQIEEKTLDQAKQATLFSALRSAGLELYK